MVHTGAFNKVDVSLGCEANNISHLPHSQAVRQSECSLRGSTGDHHRVNHPCIHEEVLIHVEGHGVNLLGGNFPILKRKIFIVRVLFHHLILLKSSEIVWNAVHLELNQRRFASLTSRNCTQDLLHQKPARRHQAIEPSTHWNLRVVRLHDCDVAPTSRSVVVFLFALEEVVVGAEGACEALHQITKRHVRKRELVNSQQDIPFFEMSNLSRLHR
mmetsp:Transcript_17759/g.41347  ORF Transcript_17759/g.41347 Transcript_17759/m.41347 type:complete len:215 (-) Transcript_17759:422-1066(-)